MKIIKIEQNERNIYEVTFKPNWFESLFGIKECVKKFKESGRSYTFGGGNVYIKENGEFLGNGHTVGVAIDNWKRKF